MRGLRGAVVMVTGAGSGIGAACAARFAAEGARVVVADADAHSAERVAVGLGGTVHVIDVGSDLQVADAVDATVRAYGRLDVMFANAGILGQASGIANASLDELDRAFAVNLRGVFSCIKHSARVMLPRRSGSIIATASPGGIVGGLGPHAYSATKAGVVGLTRSTAAELKQYGIRVNAVVPGAVATNMTMPTPPRSSPPPGMADPDDIAGAVAFLASDDARCVTGSELFVDAGITHTRSLKWRVAGDGP